MSFEQISYLAQIVASVGVVVSLIFVGLQIRQNTGALQRNEHNSTMEQWTVLRQAIAQNRDVAELMTSGLSGERAFRRCRSAETGADAAGIRLGLFPHLGSNPTRCLSKGDFRSDGWCILEHLAHHAGWRELVAHSQKYWFPSRVCLGRRCRARQDLTKRWRQPRAAARQVRSKNYEWSEWDERHRRVRAGLALATRLGASEAWEAHEFQ